MGKAGESPAFFTSLRRRENHALTDLTSLPHGAGNKLEELTREPKGQHAIRINDKWRVCFRWGSGDAYDVGVPDYY